MSIRRFFLWGRTSLTRLEVYEHDLKKKPEIPQQGRFSKIHERILDQRFSKRSKKK